MKIIIKQFICLIFLSINFISHTNAQFAAASLTQSTVATAMARYTGNDILDDNNDTYSVTVYDDALGSPGISWEVYFGGNNYASSTVFTKTTIIDPDVSLIRDLPSGAISAIVFYYDYSAPGFYLEQYTWDPSSFQFLFVTQLFVANLTYGFALNIDADENGEFAIVFDELANNDIYVAAGDLSGTGGTIALGFSNPLLTGITGNAPDVALNFNGNITYIYIDYIELTTGGDIQVQQLDYNTIKAGVFSPNIVYSMPPLSGFSNVAPRIACGPTYLSSDYWAVVYVESNGTVTNIKAVVSDAGFISSVTYNDQTLFPFNLIDISSVININLAICYDYNTDIWTGWTIDNGSLGTGSQPIFMPSVVKFDKSGITPLVTDYLEVATSPASTDYIDVLSLAGRYTKNSNLIYLSCLNAANYDIYAKQAPYSPTANLRSAINLPENLTKKLDIQETSNASTFYIYNMAGEMVRNGNAMSGDIKKTIVKYIQALPAGVYVLKTANQKGEQATQKLVATNQ